MILGIFGSICGSRIRRRDVFARSIQDIVTAHQQQDQQQEKCPFPCTCPFPTQAVCDDCLECPKQLGEPCNRTSPCDRHRGLVCRYLHDGDTDGICREDNGIPCVVYNRTYHHGETFTVDCRTQCVCQNGTYGCSSLCPQEHLSPKGTCMHPRLVDIPGQCCREWMCDGVAVEQPPMCQPSFSRWSPCSRDCGTGLSSRGSNLNARCEPATEMRVCQTRRCYDIPPTIYHANKHHLRRGHECKATHRLSAPVYFRFGPCRSRKRFRPKYCGRCTLPGMHCEPLLSTTVKVDFLCETPSDLLESDDAAMLLPEYLEPGEDLWQDEKPLAQWGQVAVTLRTLSVQWLLKCTCKAQQLTSSNITDTTAGTGRSTRKHKKRRKMMDETPEVATSSSGEVILHRVHRTALTKD